MNKVPVPKISEILKEEFMVPIDLLVADALPKSINARTSRIQAILHNCRQITTDTSV
jgi:plasmid maintenance system antidote protein VapI